MVSSVSPSDWVLPTVVWRIAAFFALRVLRALALLLTPMVYGMERYGCMYYPSRRAEWARSQVQPWEFMIHHPPKAPSSVFNHWLATKAFAGDTPSATGYS